jgi:phospholipid/cholesterol/gamma-HCH transport system substrate-binding protein
VSRRITANLVVFSVLGVLLTIWALRNVVTFDLFKQPYQIKAEFSESPGLQPNFDVAYLGVAVGKIKSVKLGDHKVIATLDIDRGSQIPDNVVAAAGRKSAIGEPYVDLSLPSGSNGGPPMRAGAVIPMSRTSVAVSYGDLFSAANKAVTGLDADALHTVTKELAAGWDGRAQSLQEILDGSSQITSTFGQNTELLDGLIGRLTQLSGTLAAHSGEFGQGLDDLTAFTNALAQANDELVQLQKTAPDLLTRFATVLKSTAQSNACTLQALSTALPAALTPSAISSLHYSQANAPTLVKTLNEISPKVNGRSNLNIDFVITLDKPKPALEYKTPRPLPTIGQIPSCPGVSVPKVAGASSSAASATASANAASPSPTTVNVRNAAGRDGEPGSGIPPYWLLYLPPLLALAVLIHVGRRAIPLLRRRRSK